MAKSKSVEKRIAIQKASKTKVTYEDLDSPQALDARIKRLAERIDRLETKYSLVAEGFQFGADETRGLFGLAPIALVFDAIAKKLR